MTKRIGRVLFVGVLLAACSSGSDGAAGPTTADSGTTTGTTTTDGEASTETAVRPTPKTSDATTTTTTATTTSNASTTTSEVVEKPADVAAAMCARTATGVAGNVDSADLIEASGLVASRAHPGVFWSHNDSGNAGGVFAVAGDGKDLGFHALAGHDAFDVEDIAIVGGEVGDDLLLADIGDNYEQRPSITISRFAEPDPRSPSPISDAEVLEFVYPDRPHNAEVLLVDEASNTVVIVTKEQTSGEEPPHRRGPTAPSVVFEGSLDGHGDAPVELVTVGTIDTPALESRTAAVIPHPASLLGFGGVPTGGDVSADGSLIAIRTYETVWLWARETGQTAAEALAGEPCEVTATLEVQGEAVAFAADGLVTLGEGANQPLNLLAL